MTFALWFLEFLISQDVIALGSVPLFSQEHLIMQDLLVLMRVSCIFEQGMNI